MKYLRYLIVFMLLAAPLSAQQGSLTSVKRDKTGVTVTFDPGVTTTMKRGTKVRVVEVKPCIGDWGPWIESDRETQPDGSIHVFYRSTFAVTQPAENGGTACEFEHGAVRGKMEVIPAPENPIIGAVVSAEELGTCSAEIHDQYTVMKDGKKYRKWHPQRDPSGCVFGHEHGDPITYVGNPVIEAMGDVPFGYIVDKTPGHPLEVHAGYKCFGAKPGDTNDEGRVNRAFSYSCFHMGTAGPARFTQQHHSAEIRLIHPEFGLHAFTQLMMDTGGFDNVCDPRAKAPTKDGVSLDNRCMLYSFYEIWGTTQYVKNQAGQTVYQTFATPAVFDPITVFNRANPTEVIYAWDARLNPILHFPNNPRGYFRGCDRESYAQPGYWYNANGPTEYWTDSMGNAVDPTDPSALRQVISASNSIGAPATNDGLTQFKMRRSWCAPGLGWKN